MGNVFNFPDFLFYYQYYKYEKKNVYKTQFPKSNTFNSLKSKMVFLPCSTTTCLSFKAKQLFYLPLYSSVAFNFTRKVAISLCSWFGFNTKQQSSNGKLPSSQKHNKLSTTLCCQQQLNLFSFSSATLL